MRLDRATARAVGRAVFAPLPLNHATAAAVDFDRLHRLRVDLDGRDALGAAHDRGSINRRQAISQVVGRPIDLLAAAQRSNPNSNEAGDFNRFVGPGQIVASRRIPKILKIVHEVDTTAQALFDLAYGEVVQRRLIPARRVCEFMTPPLRSRSAKESKMRRGASSVSRGPETSLQHNFPHRLVRADIGKQAERFQIAARSRRQRATEVDDAGSHRFGQVAVRARA